MLQLRRWQIPAATHVSVTHRSSPLPESLNDATLRPLVAVPATFHATTRVTGVLTLRECTALLNQGNRARLTRLLSLAPVEPRVTDSVTCGFSRSGR